MVGRAVFANEKSDETVVPLSVEHLGLKEEGEATSLTDSIIGKPSAAKRSTQHEARCGEKKKIPRIPSKGAPLRPVHPTRVAEKRCVIPLFLVLVAHCISGEGLAVFDEDLQTNLPSVGLLLTAERPERASPTRLAKYQECGCKR